MLIWNEDAAMLIIGEKTTLEYLRFSLSCDESANDGSVLERLFYQLEEGACTAVI